MTLSLDDFVTDCEQQRRKSVPGPKDKPLPMLGVDIELLRKVVEANIEETSPQREYTEDDYASGMTMAWEATLVWLTSPADLRAEARRLGLAHAPDGKNMVEKKHD